MRATLVLVALCALVALVSCENCNMSSDCMHLACTGMEACEQGMCTCGNHIPAAMNCTMRSDCAHMHMHGHCHKDQAHCIDGSCRCMHM